MTSAAAIVVALLSAPAFAQAVPSATARVTTSPDAAGVAKGGLNEVMVTPTGHNENLVIDHVVIIARDPDGKTSTEFYHRMLGLLLTAYVTEEIAHAGVVNATFFHAKAGRHHSLAIAPPRRGVPVSKRVHHILLDVSSLHDVVMAYDRFINAGARILVRLPGRTAWKPSTPKRRRVPESRSAGVRS